MKRGTKRHAGLSQFEFSMVLVVMAIIWLIVFDRLRDVQELGEKTAVEMTVSNIRSGLQWEMADRMMTAREASIREMAESNPIRWLEKKPEGYFGEYSAMPDRFPPGSWYFDTTRKELRYRPILARNLECQQCERTENEMILGWRIVRSANPMFGRGDRVKVVAVASFRWF